MDRQLYMHNKSNWQLQMVRHSLTCIPFLEYLKQIFLFHDLSSVQKGRPRLLQKGSPLLHQYHTSERTKTILSLSLCFSYI